MVITNSQLAVKLYFLFIILFLSLVPKSWADTKIVTLKTSPATEIGGMKVPEQHDTTTIWISDSKVRVDIPSYDMSTIYNSETGLTYVIYHKSMIYQVHVIEDIVTKSSDSLDTSVEFQETVNQMSSMMTTTVTLTDEERKIKGYLCRKYILVTKFTMMNFQGTTEIWATEDIKFDYKLYNKATILTGTKNMGSEELLKEKNKIKGLPILSIGTSKGNDELMGISNLNMKMREELIDIQELDPPKGIYEIPEGYDIYPDPDEE